MKKRKPSVSSSQDYAFLHGVIRSGAGELYQVKRESFEKLLEENGDSLQGFAKRVFGTKRFHNTTVAKAPLVLELLSDELSPASWRLIRDRLRAQPYLTDRRHTEEYAFDVALGWLEEELIIGRLLPRLANGTVIERVGIDRDREFLSLNIRATADILLRSPHRELLVDIFVDHKSTWRANGGMDLKLGKLRHFARGRLDYVLGLDLVARRFHLVSGRAAVGVPLFANAAMGGTTTARVPLGRAMTLEAVSKRLASALCATPSKG